MIRQWCKYKREQKTIQHNRTKVNVKNKAINHSKVEKLEWKWVLNDMSGWMKIGCYGEKNKTIPN